MITRKIKTMEAPFRARKWCIAMEDALSAAYQ